MKNTVQRYDIFLYFPNFFIEIFTKYHFYAKIYNKTTFQPLILGETLGTSHPSAPLTKNRGTDAHEIRPLTDRHKIIVAHAHT